MHTRGKELLPDGAAPRQASSPSGGRELHKRWPRSVRRARDRSTDLRRGPRRCRRHPCCRRGDAGFRVRPGGHATRGGDRLVGTAGSVSRLGADKTSTESMMALATLAGWPMTASPTNYDRSVEIGRATAGSTRVTSMPKGAELHGRRTRRSLRAHG